MPCSGIWMRPLNDCNEAVRLNPRSAEAYSMRAGTYGAKGEFSRGWPTPTRPFASTRNTWKPIKVGSGSMSD